MVPETVLKRRHDLDEMKAKRAANFLVNPNISRKISRKANAVRVHKPDAFIKQSRARRNLAIRYRRVQKKGMHTRASNKAQQKLIDIEIKDETTGETVVKKKTLASNSVGAPVVFAVQIKGKQPLPRKMIDLMKELRLGEANVGVFLRYDAATRRKLHLVEPFILYGILSKRAISDLVHRRGFGTVGGDRVPLKDNVVVERALGDETGIICVEDLVYEISNAGDNFESAAQFLWPFHLQAPKSRFQKKVLNDCDTRKDYGDKGEEMEDLLRTML